MTDSTAAVKSFEERLLGRVAELKTASTVKKVEDEVEKKAIKDAVNGQVSTQRSGLTTHPTIDSKSLIINDVKSEKAKGKRTKKEKVIDDYIKVHRAHLKRFNPDDVAEFESKLEDYDKLVEEIRDSNTIPELKDKVGKEMAKLAQAPSTKDIISKGKALHQMSKYAAGFVELNSKRWGYNLDGLTNDFDNAEEQAIEAWEEIYMEYSEEIDPYMSPWFNLLMAYGGVVSNRYAANKKCEEELRKYRSQYNNPDTDESLNNRKRKLKNNISEIEDRYK